MTEIFGVFGAQTFVVLIVAAIGLVPVAMYASKTSKWFVVAYMFLCFGAFATNFENLFLPGLLNFAEHLVGNMGAGLAFALAAYLYRQQSITTEETQSQVEA